MLLAIASSSSVLFLPDDSDWAFSICSILSVFVVPGQTVLTVIPCTLEQETISLRRLGSDKTETIALDKGVSLLINEVSSPS